MASLNKNKGYTGPRTHEGAMAKRQTPAQELERAIMSCMLWEDTFYESGVSIADRISSLVDKVSAKEASELAIKARIEGKLRHAPLWVANALTKKGGRVVGDTLEAIINRPDELTEFMAMYWKDGKKPVAKQVKRGLGRAFTKFDEYQLAKYNRDGEVKLRDVLFMVHAKPKDEKQAEVWRRLVNDELKTPDTWETNLSAGKDKKETFTRLLKENKLGYMALLRNLRNMHEAGVDRSLIEDAIIKGAKNSKALPFRFIAAAKHARTFEAALDKGLIEAVRGLPKLEGKTAVVVDVSASMDATLSNKSGMTREDAACGLAMIVAGTCDEYDVFAFGTDTKFVSNNRQGMALRDAIKSTYVGHATDVDRALNTVANHGSYDRVIVITDEQSRSTPSYSPNKGYIINVASYQNGIGFGKWVTINGFSENTVKFIQALEAAE